MKLDPDFNPIARTDALVQFGILPKKMRLYMIAVDSVNTFLPSVGYLFLLLSMYRWGFNFGRAFRLERLVWRAYEKGRYQQAATLAEEWLTRAEKCKAIVSAPWRLVYGDAIHEGNQVLGLVRLKAGQTDAAIAHLLAAGNTPGSCTLNSYGPRLLLPKALIEMGQTEVVIEYLDLLARFWAVKKDARFKEMEKERTFLIKQWKAHMRKGTVPEHPMWK